MTMPYSREAERVLQEARDLAIATRRRQSSAHVLLALFTEPNHAQRHLREHKIDEDRLLDLIRVVEDDPPGLLETIFKRAQRIAQGTQATAITSLHLLTALSGFKDCAGYRLMQQTGVDLARIRTTAMSFFVDDSLPTRFRVKPGDDPGIQADRRRTGEQPRRRSSSIGFHPDLQPPRRPRRVKEKEPSPADKAAKDQADLAKRLFGAGARFKHPTQPPGDEAPAPISGKGARDTNLKTPIPTSPNRPVENSADRERAETRQKVENGTAALPDRKNSREAPVTARKVITEIDETRFELSTGDFPTLCSFGRNLTAEANLGNIDPIIGRDREIGLLIDILNKRRANNPVLVGKPGVGKTAVVEGLARLIASDKVPPGLDGKILIEIDPGRILSGTGLRGSLAERLISLKDEVESAQGGIIVFLDEIHRWIGGGAERGDDGAQDLKPALARGTFPCVGATTDKEYRKCTAEDPAFGRRFQTVRVEEPSVDETIQILEGLREEYSRHHGAEFSDEALVAAARLSHRYLTERLNPEKALSVLDMAGSVAHRMEMDIVTEAVIAEVIGEMAGIPPSKLLMADRERFLRMEDHLMKSIVGHERNLSRIGHVLRRNYAGFVSGRPIGSFLFLGPTGVGKTETAKVLCNFLFHSSDAMTIIDMSELGEAHSIARLIGAPPGYVGHESGGQLTESVRRRPYQVVLFDEVEKSHPTVQNLLLQLLDEGRLTDSSSHVSDFSNTVIIMTSNVGGRVFEAATPVGFGQIPQEAEKQSDRVIEAARSAFEPELWNRIDEPLVFEPLTRPQIERIAHLKLSDSSQRLLDEKGIAYTTTQDVIDFLIKHGGFDPQLGARPLRRTMEHYVEGPIAELILRGDAEAPSEIAVDVENGELVFDVS